MSQPERRASINSLDHEVDNNGKPEELTTESALALVQPFFPEHWAKLSPADVTLKKLTGGFCNSIHVITRKTSRGSEPISMLIRRKGGNMFDVDEMELNSDVSLTIIQYEISRRGLGPKLYGVIKGGTIEEYINSHTLSMEESTLPEISRDLALSFAAIHAIKGLPLKQTIFEESIKLQREWFKLIPGVREYFIKNEALKNYNLDYDFIFNFDYAAELGYLLEKVDQIKMRKNFILHDRTYMNCLVKNNPKDGELRVMLIDYDLSHYGYRGIDLGSHFLERRFDYGNEQHKIIKNSTFPSIKEKRTFLTIYQQEIKKLNVWPDFDENGIDSVDNLLMESMIGQMHYTLYFASFMIAKPGMILEVDPSFASCVEFWLKIFLITKSELEMITQ